MISFWFREHARRQLPGQPAGRRFFSVLLLGFGLGATSLASAQPSSALARIAPSGQACPGASQFDQQGCRLRELRSSEQGRRLIALTSQILDAPLGREAIGWFFMNMIPRCVFARPGALPDAWQEAEPRFARLVPSEIHQLAEKTESFAAYRSELQDRLLVDDRPETLEIASEISRRPGARRIVGAYLESALRLPRPDCSVLSANEQQVIRQLVSELAR